MLKTKFQITVNSNGDELNYLIQMMANHNGGKAKITIDDIVGYLNAQKSLLPNTRSGMAIKHEGHAPETIHISDNDGKSFYLTITECTYEELVMPEQLDNVANISQQGDQC